MSTTATGSVTGVLVSMTARQLLGRRRTALIGAAMLIPVVIAVVYRLADPADAAPPDQLAIGLVSRLILTLLLPLVALVLGTAALGAEIEDGTALFLVTTPVERWRIIVVKIAVSAGATMLLVVPATVATAAIIRGSLVADGIVPGLALAAAVASLLYCAVFVALSAAISRALVFGLAYVFLWEGLITGLFDNLQWVSVREYAEGWGDLLITITDERVYDPQIGVPAAIVGSAVILVLACWGGTRAFARFEVGERG